MIRVDPNGKYGLMAFAKDDGSEIDEEERKYLRSEAFKKDTRACDKFKVIDYDFPENWTGKGCTTISSKEEYEKHLSRRCWFLAKDSVLLFKPTSDRSWQTLHLPFL